MQIDPTLAFDGAPAPVPSTRIRLKGLRQIFVWPLALDLESWPGRDVGAAMRRVGASFGAHSDWEERVDLLDHLAPTHAEARLRPEKDVSKDERAHSYAEFVYFYDFLQHTLFAHGGRRRPDERPIRLWRHTRLEEIEFTLAVPDDLDMGGRKTKDETATYRAVVDRLSVHLFDSGAAIVTLEVDFGEAARLVTERDDDGHDRTTLEPLLLSDAETIADHLRRSYTPFFSGDTPMRVPRTFIWRLKQKQGPDRENRLHRVHSLDDDHRFVKCGRTATGTRRRRAPVAEHWRDILAPLVFSGYGNGRDPSWRHVLDERIPAMSFVSLSGAAAHLGIEPAARHYSHPDNAVAQRNDFALVSRGDWIRLCYADEAGADALPYNSKFLEAFEKEAVYDRFAADPATTSAMRILFAGYHFAIVGAGWFVDNLVVHHFRRHYYQMVLLANLELASLLVTSSRITLAVGELRSKYEVDPGGPRHRAFMEELESINEWFLTFVHRFRFSGVSNQIQPTELFDRLRSSMRLDPLYGEVKEELEAAVAFNSSCEERRVAASGERLAAVATIGASVGLAFAFLGMNVVVDPLRERLYKTTKSEGDDAQGKATEKAAETKSELSQLPFFPVRSPSELVLADVALLCATMAVSTLATKAMLIGLRSERKAGPSPVDRILTIILWASVLFAFVLGVKAAILGTSF